MERGQWKEFLHIFLCFDTTSLRPVISMWPEGERPTKVIAIFEVDELKTCLPIASGMDISGDDTFLLEVRCTWNPRIFECHTMKEIGRLYDLVSSLHPSDTYDPEKLSIYSKVLQHFRVELRRVAPHLRLWDKNSHARFCRNFYRMVSPCLYETI